MRTREWLIANEIGAKLSAATERIKELEAENRRLVKENFKLKAHQGQRLSFVRRNVG